MKKDKRKKSPSSNKEEKSSTDKTPEFGTFNDLEWDIIDEVDFSSKTFIKVALINKAYASTCGVDGPMSSNGNSKGASSGYTPCG